MLMLPRVVEYLRSNGVPFRLQSYPSPEPGPPVAYRVASATTLVETRVLLVDGRPTIGCIPRGDNLNLTGFREHTKAEIIEEGSLDDLPWFFDGTAAPIPPLGRLFGVPLFVDERVSNSDVICFAAFAPTDSIEMTYDDLARLEQPRVVPLAIAGELPAPSLH